jgi:hypothetical protein
MKRGRGAQPQPRVTRRRATAIAAVLAVAACRSAAGAGAPAVHRSAQRCAPSGYMNGPATTPTKAPTTAAREPVGNQAFAWIRGRDEVRQGFHRKAAGRIESSFQLTIQFYYWID